MKKIFKKFAALSLAAAMIGGCCCLASCGDSFDPLYDELVANAQTAETACLTFDASFNVQDDGAGGTGSAAAHAVLDLEGLPAADLLADISLGGQEMYTVGFLRGDTLYVDGVETPRTWQTGLHDLDALVNAYKTSPDLVLTQMSAEDLGLTDLTGPTQGLPQQLASLPFMTKLSGNLPLLLGAIAKKTDGGYVVEYDLVAGLEDVVDSVCDTLDKVDKDTTLSDLLFKGYPDIVLRTLFHGIEADEFFGAMNGTTVILPDGMDLYDYLKKLLSSEEFYSTFQEQSFGALPEGKTLGGLTLGDLAKLGGGSEEDIDASLGELKDMLAQVKENVVGVLLGLLSDGVAGGTLESAKVSLLFDGDKTPKGIGIELDGLELTVTPLLSSETQTFKADGSITISYEDSVSVADIRGVRYASDEYETGVLAESVQGPTEILYPLDLGLSADPNSYPVSSDAPFEVTVTSGKDGMTYSLVSEEDNVHLEYTIPLSAIEEQLASPATQIKTEYRGAVHDGHGYTIMVLFDFEEREDGYRVDISYRTLLDDALSETSYGYGFLPSVLLPFSRVVKTLA